MLGEPESRGEYCVDRRAEASVGWTSEQRYMLSRPESRGECWENKRAEASVG